MGVDLTLLPFNHDAGDWGFSHTMLPIDRSDLLRAVMDIEDEHGESVPAKFSTYTSRDDKYEESHYGETQETPYGEPLRCVRVKHLLPLADLADENSPQNNGAWAYLKWLPPETKVALYWH